MENISRNVPNFKNQAKFYIFLLVPINIIICNILNKKTKKFSSLETVKAKIVLLWPSNKSTKLLIGQ